MANKAIFLDRDDTLIEDPGYINDPDDVKLLPGAAETLAGLRKMGYKLIVVTNQSAIARGIVSEEVLEEIHGRLETLLSRQGVSLDAIYYCPFHPDGVIGKYRRESDLRKPSPGMLLAAAEDLDIDLKQSWMIGNSYSDVAAGLKAGCKTILISSSASPPQKKKSDPKPDKIAVNIKEAVNIVKMYQRKGKVVRPRKSRKRRPESSIASEEAKEMAQTAKASQSAKGADSGKVQNSTAAAVEQDTTNAGGIAARMEEVKRKIAKERSATAKTARGGRSSTVKEKTDEDRHTQTPRRSSGEDSGTPPKTQEVLEEVVRYLKKLDRLGMYEEFSIVKVLAGVAQVVVLFLLLMSIWFLLDHTYSMSSVQTTLGYATVLQLMVIAFHMMRDRR
jgi:D-glycero-D-manno-heptose 1,7-bisphosphate phosphatase